MQGTLSKNVFIDPSPTSPELVMESASSLPSGGAASLVVVTIVACGGRLGSAAVITTGTAVITVIDRQVV